MLSIENVTCRIAGREIIGGATAHLPAGRRIGLVGRNGAGKSTLLKLVSGELSPDAGEINRPPGWRVGALAQEAPTGSASLIDTVLSVDTARSALLAESESSQDPARMGEVHARLEAIEAYSAPARAAAILAGLGFSADEQQRPCCEFSGGWRMRVALAAILFAAPDLLLLDEPTNYLDLEGVLWLQDYLARYRGTVVIVSHDRELLDATTEFILHLEHGRLALYSGNYGIFVETREQRRALDAASAKKQELARRHMQAFVDRFRYKQSKARQAQSRIKMLARLKPADIVPDEQIPPIRLPNARPASPPLLSLDAASVGYEPGRPVLTQLSLRIDPDDRIALLGRNGNGKSTFARLLAGKLAPMSGSVVRAPKLTAGYFAQHQLEELDGTLTPLETLGMLRRSLGEQELRTRLGSFGLSGDKALTKIGQLSGGERARLMLALSTLDSPNLLILDEPTNHLDMDARNELLVALNDFEGAVILVSHDRWLIEATIDRLLLVADGTVKSFEGDLEEYRQKVLLSEVRSRELEKSRSARDRGRGAADLRATLKPLREKAAAAEREIERLTTTLAELDAALSAPGAFAENPVKAGELARRRSAAMNALAEAETRWFAASQAYEGALAGRLPSGQPVGAGGRSKSG